MTLNRAIFFSGLVVFLTSCAHTPQYTYLPPNSTKALACTHICATQQRHCEAQCADSHNPPLYFSHQQEFNQDALAPDEGFISPTNLMTAHSTYKSNGESCPCLHLYNECYSHCGGKVSPKIY